MIMPFSLNFVLALTLVSTAVAAPPSAKAIAKEVDQHYNSLITLRAAFTESYDGTGISRTETGVLTLKKPGKMRWEYSSPSQKLFLMDGKSAFLYLPADHQARKMPAKDLDDFRSPLRYLLGHSELAKELDGLHVESGERLDVVGDVVLSGRPKHLSDRVANVELEVTSKRQIERIAIREVDGTTTAFRFSDIKEDQPASDSQFHFTPPAGTEVIDAPSGSGE